PGSASAWGRGSWVRIPPPRPIAKRALVARFCYWTCRDEDWRLRKRRRSTAGHGRRSEHRALQRAMARRPPSTSQNLAPARRLSFPPLQGSWRFSLGIAPLTDLDERRKSLAQHAKPAFADVFPELGVDGFARSRLGCGGLAATPCQGHDQPAAILGVDVAFQITAHDQGIHQLTRGLFGNAQIPDEGGQ